MSREIEWITNRGVEDRHYSDHKMLKYEVYTKGVGGRTIGELVPKPKYEQPKAYSKEAWKIQLEEVMGDFEEELEELDELLDQDEVNVEKEWKA